MQTFLFRRRGALYLVCERTALRALRRLHEQHGSGEDFDLWSKPVETLGELPVERGQTCLVEGC